MTTTSFFQKVLIVALVIAVTLLLWTYRHWFLIGLLAIVIAVGLSLPTNALSRRGLPHSLAATVSVLGFFLVLSVLLLWIVPTFVNQTFGLLGAIPEQFPIVGELLEDLLPDTLPDDGPNVPVPDVLEQDLSGLAAEVTLPSDEPATAAQRLETLWDNNEAAIRRALSLLPSLFRGAQTTLNVLGQLIITLFLALLFLATPYAYLNASLYLVPEDKRPRMLELWQALYKTLTTWLSALSISISVTVSLTWVLLGLVIGMPSALLAAVIAGVATFIPNIGAFLPILPIAVFSLSAAPSMIFLTIPAYLLVQLLESNVITPLVVKSQLSLPPAALLLFQVIAGLVFGFLGVLMAVPIFASIVTLVRELYSKDVLGYDNDSTVVVANDAGNLVLAKQTPPQKTKLSSFFKRC